MKKLVARYKDKDIFKYNIINEFIGLVKRKNLYNKYYLKIQYFYEDGYYEYVISTINVKDVESIWVINDEFNEQYCVLIKGRYGSITINCNVIDIIKEDLK